MGVDLELRNERRRLWIMRLQKGLLTMTKTEIDLNCNSTILSVSVIGLGFMSGRIPSATLGSADWGFGTRFGGE